MFCSNCGTKVTENDLFCPECGMRIERPAAPVAQETREPIVIPEPEPAAPVVTPVTAFEPEPAVRKKKSKKGLIIGIIAAVVALGLAAAAIFWLVPMLRNGNAKEAVIGARTALENVNSAHSDMKMEMKISLSFLGQSQTMELEGNYAIDSMKDPMRSYIEMQMSSMGQQMDAIVYTEIVDGEMVQYSSSDGGAHWTTSNSQIQNIDQEKLLNVFMDNAENFRKIGTETVNGSAATVYSCELGEQYVEDTLLATGLAESLGDSFGEITDDLLKDLGSIPMTMAIDDKTGYPVHYTIDLSGTIQNLFKNLMQKAMEQSGMSGIEIEINVETCKIDAVMSKYNEVYFEIPEEVKNPSAVTEEIVGTWALVGGEGEEAEETVQLLLAFGMTMTFTFNEDGTGNLTYSYEGQSESEDFEYTLEEDQIVIEGTGADYRIEDDKLIIEVDGYTMIFEKQ